MTNKNRHGGYYTPRININCSPEHLTRSQKLFTRDGLRSDVLLKFLDWLLAMMEKHGETVAASIAYSNDDFASNIKEIAKADTASV